MNQQQKTDFGIWKQHQSQPLPDSLKNVLIEDCLEELFNNEFARNSFNKLHEQGELWWDSTQRKLTSRITFPSLKVELSTEENWTNHYEPYEVQSLYFNFSPRGDSDSNSHRWENLSLNYNRQTVIQTLLSRTPDGQAVMPFLGVELEEVKEAREELKELEKEFGGGYPNRELTFNDHARIKRLDQLNYLFMNSPEPLTLDHLLYREFTEALRTGKTFEEALEIITKIYILNVYV